MNPWKQNPDPFFNSKSQFLEVVCGSRPTFAIVYQDLVIVRKPSKRSPKTPHHWKYEICRIAMFCHMFLPGRAEKVYVHNV